MIQESNSGSFYSFYQVEKILQNLVKDEDKTINQFIKGEISLDTYCSLLVNNGKQEVV